mgnify:CR=1 FL=1
MTDIEIARKTKLENIDKIAKKLGIDEENLEIYGKYKAKISDNLYMKKNPFVILFLISLPLIIFTNPGSLHYRQRPDTSVLSN